MSTPTLKELVSKAAHLQAMEDACPGHLWVPDYVSKIVAGTGSCRCEICGTRRSWADAKREHGTVFKHQLKGKP